MMKSHFMQEVENTAIMQEKTLVMMIGKMDVRDAL